MNDLLYYSIIAILLVLILRLVAVTLFSKERKTQSTLTNNTFSAKKTVGNLAKVNTHLNNLEKNSKVYVVKAEGTSAIDRTFNIGTNEERLSKAEKYYSIVLQNFRYSQLRVEPEFGLIYNSLKLTIICLSNIDGKTEEHVIKSVNENKDSYNF